MVLILKKRFHCILRYFQKWYLSYYEYTWISERFKLCDWNYVYHLHSMWGSRVKRALAKSLGKNCFPGRRVVFVSSAPYIFHPVSETFQVKKNGGVETNPYPFHGDWKWFSRKSYEESVKIMQNVICSWLWNIWEEIFPFIIWFIAGKICFLLQFGRGGDYDKTFLSVFPHCELIYNYSRGAEYLHYQRRTNNNLLYYLKKIFFPLQHNYQTKHSS